MTTTVFLRQSEFTPFHISIYEAAFPPEERRPSGNPVPDDEAFRFYNIATRDVAQAGLLTLWSFGTFRYIEHLAVDSNLRGNGIGAAALAEVENPVVLEVEPPETSAMAARRVEFYKRQGFRLLEVPYVQPPYSPGLPPVRLCLMLRGRLLVPVSEVIRTLHSRVYGAENF
ncbi:MAG: GNAT family N-acetyltransferase [Muribaculaceae bacterium]|nr:GNAT family N-acetyltransferase [Muribaculaceae bacterium]